jgi:hypothetical protein
MEFVELLFDFSLLVFRLGADSESERRFVSSSVFSVINLFFLFFSAFGDQKLQGRAAV